MTIVISQTMSFMNTIRIICLNNLMFGKIKLYHSSGLKDSHLIITKTLKMILSIADFVEICQQKNSHLITFVLPSKMKKLNFLVRFVTKFYLELKVLINIWKLIKKTQMVLNQFFSNKDHSFSLRDISLPLLFLIIKDLTKHNKSDLIDSNNL